MSTEDVSWKKKKCNARKFLKLKQIAQNILPRKMKFAFRSKHVNIFYITVFMLSIISVWLVRWHAKFLTCEISDFTPCPHVQSKILHTKYADKTDY